MEPRLRITAGDDAAGGLGLTCAQWPGLRLDGLRPSLRLDGLEQAPLSYRVTQAEGSTALRLEYAFAGGTSLTLTLEPWHNAGVRLAAVLCVVAAEAAVLNEVCLLDAGPGSGSGTVAFGAVPERVRLMEQQGGYGGRVRRLGEPLAGAATLSAGEPNEAPATTKGASDVVWVAYDQQARMAFLAGFLTSERWLGRIDLESTPAGGIQRWRVGFDGADVRLSPGATIRLEDVLLMVGDDPWALLETYADAVRSLHQPLIPERPPVSWCSWYPYRLGVTEERVLDTARLAAQRLKPLGLSIVEVDLGWEQGNLPSVFVENERFPHGLKWLAEQLRRFGFDLGVWTAPYTISEFDPLAQEHPEYLVQDQAGRPASYWEWFWEPHGKVFILDLTHPGAQQWLRAKMESLYERGVRYLKNDFIGCAAHALARRRHDSSLAAGGGTQAARLGAQIIREALPEALILNCGGPEMPGPGHWPLLYTCNDTGNTGFISHAFQQANHEAVACHLWKNGRWGIVQASCLCVGGPGTVEDARLRATMAFLSGGQIDISDTLATLPEDRWAILTATLPPLGLSARPVDLFEPLEALPFDYEGTCRGQGSADRSSRELPPGSVWHLHVRGEWDEWDLVGIFCYASGSAAAKPEISRFAIPLSRLGIPDSARHWGYEFWSGQFLGAVPGRRLNPGGYVHPGDYQDLATGDAQGVLDLSFFGPGAKLICLRPLRPHPWVAGTSFHQSCGTELRGVAWEPDSGTLRGEVDRPTGEAGFVVIPSAGLALQSAEVEGREVQARSGANGALVLPVAVGDRPARWQVRFKPAQG
jgi:hypothetical protein